MAKNRIIAFSEDGKTKYVTKAKYKYNDGDRTCVLETSDTIPLATLYSLKESFGIIELLNYEGYPGAVDIKLHEEHHTYSVQPKIIAPSFISDEFGLMLRVETRALRLGDKINYTDKTHLINLGDNYHIYNNYQFKSKEDANWFCDNNQERLFERIIRKFKML